MTVSLFKPDLYVPIGNGMMASHEPEMDSMDFMDRMDRTSGSNSTYGLALLILGMALCRVSRTAFKTLLVVWVVFGTLTMVIVASNEGPSRGLISAVGSISGPVTGAISRGFQSCCMEFSLHLVPYFLPFLGLALISHLFVRSDESKARNRTRLAIWSLGWVGWFSGAFLSFLHALS